MCCLLAGFLIIQICVFSKIKVDHIQTAISSLSLTTSAEITSSRTNKDKIKETKEVIGVWALKEITMVAFSTQKGKNVAMNKDTITN